MEATMQDIYLTIPSSDSHRKPELMPTLIGIC